MEKKSLNKKLQLNKETIAILDKEQQSQILGGEIPSNPCNTSPGFCLPQTETCPPKAPESFAPTCVLSVNYCPPSVTCPTTTPLTSPC